LNVHLAAAIVCMCMYIKAHVSPLTIHLSIIFQVKYRFTINTIDIDFHLLSFPLPIDKYLIIIIEQDIAERYRTRQSKVED